MIKIGIANSLMKVHLDQRSRVQTPSLDPLIGVLRRASA